MEPGNGSHQLQSETGHYGEWDLQHGGFTDDDQFHRHDRRRGHALFLPGDGGGWHGRKSRLADDRHDAGGDERQRWFGAKQPLADHREAVP